MDEPHSARSATLVVPVLAVAVVVLAACSGTTSSSESRRATPTTFAVRRFDQLPKPTRTHAIGLRTHRRGVTIRSYESRNRTPEQILDFYDRVLPQDGWIAVPSLSEQGSPYERTYRSGGYRLRITAQMAPTVLPDTPVVQFSLEVSRPSSTP